jgi:hypothetical protein
MLQRRARGAEPVGRDQSDLSPGDTGGSEVVMKATAKKAMEPVGSFYKLPFPEYLSLPYMSVHGLKLFSEDPIAYLLSFQNIDDKSTPALDQGKAFHCRILTPELYYSEIAEAPDVPKRSDAQKEYWAKFEAVNNGKVILSHAIIQEIEFMAASVAANPRAMKLLSGGESEMTGYGKTAVDSPARSGRTISRSTSLRASWISWTSRPSWVISEAAPWARILRTEPTTGRIIFTAREPRPSTISIRSGSTSSSSVSSGPTGRGCSPCTTIR